MKRDKLEDALSQISDQHIAEAAEKQRKKRPVWIAPLAAVLAVAILITSLSGPLTLRAMAVSEAEYPKYEYDPGRGDIMEAYMQSLYPFFAGSIAACLAENNGENRVFSPANLYLGLSELSELAAGDARQEILDLLGADSQASLRAQANDIWDACYLDNGHSKTILASSLWLDGSLGYDQAVMDTLAETYYTSVYQADLGSRSANRAISAWLDGQTGGRLTQATGRINLDPETVFALYATVYYRAKWSMFQRFSPSDNTQGTFHAAAGDMDCTFMNQKELKTVYYYGADYGAVALSLVGDRLSSRMWLILPDEGKTVADVLAAGEYAQTVFCGGGAEAPENSRYVKANLSLPKFDLSSSQNLKETLEKMGITQVFRQEAEAFSPAVEGPAWLSGVNQATRITVDEEGVTAATYLEFPGAGAAAPPDEIIDFVLDRPFLFVLTNAYNVPLFAGVVEAPS